MIIKRNSDERGFADHGWLQARHSFSFANYDDPTWHQWGALRVLNQDVIGAGMGFGLHPHRDMEIVTIVLEGELAHKDSAGHESVLRAGDVQYMSAGSGIMHSEFNHSRESELKLFQTWIEPAERGGDPRYGEQRDTGWMTEGTWVDVVAPEAEQGNAVFGIRQAAHLSVGTMADGDAREVSFAPGRVGWVQVASGKVAIGDAVFEAGDGAAIKDELLVELVAQVPETRLVVFSVPGL